MLPKAKELLGVVTKVVGGMPQKIAITGHTDATPYHNADGYSNWELSADRALASRREMLGFGLDPARVIRVAGMAAADPFVRDNPYDPSNRRISIVLLREYRPVRPPAVVQPESLDIGPPAPSKRVRDRFRNPFVRD